MSLELDRPRLADLLGSIDPAVFYARHWAPGAPFLSEPSAALRRKVEAHPALASIDALLSTYGRDVGVFGPGSLRRSVPASRARSLLGEGCNVYFPRVSEAVPWVAELFEDIALALGFAPRQVNIEAFAGSAGGVSSRHFDHELNFQILLRGEKEWRFEPNRHIDNPLVPYHPVLQEDGQWSGFSEEGYSRDPVMPSAFDPRSCHCLRATAGTTIFAPRGTWHETRSLTDTWGVNVAIKGTPWAESLASALVARLLESPRLRAYGDGYRGRTLGAMHARDRARIFEELKAEGRDALRDLPLASVEPKTR